VIQFYRVLARLDRVTSEWPELLSAAIFVSKIYDYPPRFRPPSEWWPTTIFESAPWTDLALRARAGLDADAYTE
jgi:hypothetical protein